MVKILEIYYSDTKTVFYIIIMRHFQEVLRTKCRVLFQDFSVHFMFGQIPLN